MRFPRPLLLSLSGSLFVLAPRVAVAAPAEGWNDLALRRAAALLTEGDAAGAAEVLAARDSAAADPRADFLEAWAARALGDAERFRSLAARLRAQGGDCAHWADVLARIDAARTPPGLRGDGDAPAESLAALFHLDVRRAAQAARPAGADARRARREGAAAGLRALSEHRLEDAQRLLGDAEASWRAEGDALAALSNPADSVVDDVFARWDVGGAGERPVRLDVGATEGALRERLDAALDLTKRPSGDLPAPTVQPGVDDTTRRALLPAPTAAERRRADEIAAEGTAARARLAADRRRLSLAEAEANRAGRYFGRGLDRANAENRALERTIARLKVLIARSGELVAQLAEIRDDEIRRIAARTARFLEVCRDQLVVANALSRFRVQGPAARHPEALPPEVPSPAEILHEETLLAAALEGWLSAFTLRAPELVARSHDGIWKPRATAGLRELADLAARQAARAQAIAAAVDSTRHVEVDPAARATLARSVADGEARERERAEALRAERRRVVVAAVDAARDAHQREGEGLLYGGAATAHELALAGGDAGTDHEGARALLAAAEDHYRAFLDAYPRSAARSEVRFRLADVLLHDAREDFRTAMTRFLGESGAATESDERALAPFVDYGPALEIYLSLLADDPTFAHRDAVLYHAGMILADENDPKGLVHLAMLVQDYPASPHAQEAHLRLGDDLLTKKELRAALAHYEAAAAGRDPEHSAIALYHAGWARFQLDDFDGSAAAFRRLMLLYGEHPEAARTTDLRDEAEDHLVQALARGGGANAFERLFPRGDRSAKVDEAEPRLLARLGDLFREYSRFDEAVAADSSWLARWPADPRALDAARRLAATLERAERPDAARRARLDWADRFRAGSPWWQANGADSLRQAGDEFARGAHVGAALHHHRLAREKNAPADWRAAADQYAALLEGWPTQGAAPAWRYGAGEAAMSLGRYEDAVRHFVAAAAADTASFRVDAAWHAVTARDAWYESERPAAATAGAERGAGPERLARSLVDSIDQFVGRNPEDEHVAELLWRKGHVAKAHGWSEASIDAFAKLASAHPTDTRALDASRLAAQLLVDREEFRRAADAYASAARLARTTGRDAIAVELEAAVPACAYRDAESVAKKKGEGEDSARLFEDVAARWPKFEHAPRALYRAGAGWAAAGETADAVRVWTLLGERYPQSDLARDAALETARAWKAAGRMREAARASEHFAAVFPDDPDAAGALLDAADLAAAAGDSADAERIEDQYVATRPKDVETAMSILERRARRELAAVTPQRPVSGLLAAPTRTKPGSATRRWLDLAKENPALAARDLEAQISFLRGEEARAACERVSLTWPLGPSVAQKKSLLENALQEYRSCAAHEVAPWNRAAAARIGECLVSFGDALMDSERPADLGGDDLAAYEEELEKKSWAFFDRGEEVWTQLVRHADDAPGDEWVERARRELWPRVARKFSHVPEVDFPLVPATSPAGEIQP